MQSDTNNLTGKTLGTCVLQNLIGQGGMGAVYLAQQTRPSRNVAVKILLPDLNTDSQVYLEFLARFRREADVIARLEHINIIPIYEYGEQDGLAYLVMPYLPAGSLRDRLQQRGALSLPETIICISEAAAALDYAHEHNVIHRDLKPANFLLHTDGRLVLADFGIARIIQESDATFHSTLTGPGMMLGTPEYMAPEMILGTAIDQRVDTYALGIILFQMLSGRVPFTGTTPFAVATKHMQESPPSLHSMNPVIPSAVDTIIQKALAKNPENRYISTGLLAQELRNTMYTSSPDYFSDATTGDAPTVISSSSANTPIKTFPAQNTMPPLYQAGNIPTAFSARNTPSSDGFTQLVTPHPTSYARSEKRQQPWLIFIGVLLVMVLVVGGILIGLQLNKGASNINGAPGVTTTTPQSSHSTSPVTGTQTTPATSPTAGVTATSRVSGVPKGVLLYSTMNPGAGSACDSGGGQWANYNHPLLSCQSTETTITNPNSQSPNLVGVLLIKLPGKAFPSNYVVEMHVQQASSSNANFGIYFRNQQGNQQGVYTFFVLPDGTWRAYVYDNTTGAQTEMTSGNFGDAHAPVTIDIVVTGSQFTFYANGQQVGGITNDIYPTGTAGIAVDTGGSILVSSFSLYQTA